MPTPTQTHPNPIAENSSDTMGVMTSTLPAIRYILYYFKGSPHAQFTFIDFPADWKLQQIVERVKQYCNTCGMRFVRIEPMMTDMAKAERVYGDNT